MGNVVPRMYAVLAYMGADIVQVMYQMKCKILHYPVHICQIQYFLRNYVCSVRLLVLSIACFFSSGFGTVC